jgi:hypothetical protein
VWLLIVGHPVERPFWFHVCHVAGLILDAGPDAFSVVSIPQSMLAVIPTFRRRSQVDFIGGACDPTDTIGQVWKKLLLQSKSVVVSIVLVYRHTHHGGRAAEGKLREKNVRCQFFRKP